MSRAHIATLSFIKLPCTATTAADESLQVRCHARLWDRLELGHGAFLGRNLLSANCDGLTRSEVAVISRATTRMLSQWRVVGWDVPVFRVVARLVLHLLILVFFIYTLIRRTIALIESLRYRSWLTVEIAVLISLS